MNSIKRELEDYKLLLRNVPSLVVSLFIVSVISMNLLANKEWFTTPYLALDCGFTVSWVSFLCMDMICRRFGGKAAAKISILAMVVNLAVFVLFRFAAGTSGMWGQYYETESLQVNDALNATFAGSWQIVIGSSIAMLCGAVTNSAINGAIGKRLKNKSFGDFALRSYVSTALGQFVDNFVFAVIVSVPLFGWTMTQVVSCSILMAGFELVCEVVLSPIAYRITCGWDREHVGEAYLAKKALPSGQMDATQSSL